jgi:hypothetical protein
MRLSFVFHLDDSVAAGRSEGHGDSRRQRSMSDYGRAIVWKHVNVTGHQGSQPPPYTAMAIDRSGKWWRGGSSADIEEYLTISSTCCSVSAYIRPPASTNSLRGYGKQ